jgi:hypothetical protein
MPSRLPKGVKHVVHDGNQIRLIIPDKARMCAPCVPESNLCLEGSCLPPPLGKKSQHIHLRPEGNLTFPAVKWLRQRISEREWNDFIGGLDEANLMGTVPFYAALLFPCTFPGLLCQPACCCTPFQFAAGKALEAESCTNLVLARFNRYLFLPRGLIARRQVEIHKTDTSDGAQFAFLVIDVVPEAPLPMALGMLGEGLRPGTHANDANNHPLRHPWPWQDVPMWTWPSCFRPNGYPSVLYFLEDEPEIEDTRLMRRYKVRNDMYASSGGYNVGPDRMVRA